MSVPGATAPTESRIDEATVRVMAGGERETRVEAAVLVPLFRDDEGEIRMVLVARGLAGIHGGQVALPGGKLEPSDSSPLEAELRETAEEIGVPRGAIDVLAAVEPVDTRSTGFRVHPFIACIRVPAQWQLAADEIVAVLTPRLHDLADPAWRESTTVSFTSWPAPRVVDSWFSTKGIRSGG